MFEKTAIIILNFNAIIMRMVSPIADVWLKNSKLDEELKQLIAQKDELAAHKSIKTKLYFFDDTTNNLHNRKNKEFKNSSIFKTWNETFYSLKLELDKHGK